MRIAIFPGYDDSAASSRIRAHTLQRSLVSLGHDARIGDAGPHADVVLVQKRASRKTIAMMKTWRAQGSLVIFDLDDVGRDLWYSAPPSVLRRVLEVADIVTTDTAGHRLVLTRDYDADLVEIIPDTIDYFPNAPSMLSPPSGHPLRILWFGNAANIALFTRYARVIEGIPDVELVAVTNVARIGELSNRFPRTLFLPWARETFVGILQSCALTLLPHDGTETDRLKSNNRMIASITWGVPALVTRTPEYERTAAEAGVAHALFSSEAELMTTIERLRSVEARSAYLCVAQPAIWELYSPHTVAMRFLAMVSRASDRQMPRRQRGYLPWLRKAAKGHVLFALVRESTHLVSQLLHGDQAFEIRS
jgi:hypothetical protein